MSLPNLIILEGPPGAGKTTFLKHFLDLKAYKSGYPYRDKGYLSCHFGAAPGATLEEVENWYSDILEVAQGQRLILDRWIVSNAIYSHYLQNQIALGSAGIRKVWNRAKFWYGDSIATLYFDCRLDVLRERNLIREREPFMDTLAAASQTYRDFRDIGKYMNPAYLDTTHIVHPRTTFDRGMGLLEAADARDVQ